MPALRQNGMMDTLPGTLQSLRKGARLSQMELSFRLGVSQRHVSYVESGRARPSRGLLLTWLQELNGPLVVRNAAMLQAGYAPAFGEARPGDASLTQAEHALTQLLSAHDPMPAFVLDASWNVLQFNRGGFWLAGLLIPFLADQPPGTPLNMLDAMGHPEGPVAAITNLAEVGPALLAHLRHEASMHPPLISKVEAYARLLAERLGPPAKAKHSEPPAPRLAPVLTTRFRTSFGELAFFSMFTTFGTPQDITLASLKVEHMFAADAATGQILRENLG